MRVAAVVVGFMVLTAVLAVLGLNTVAAVNSPEENYPLSSDGLVAVSFNSVQLDLSAPQAYAFGITVTAAPGFTITWLHWDFGDGIFLDVPYCCQSQVTEVRYHAYQQPGSYNVTVTAYDSGGNSGEAAVNVGWPTPVPEFTSITMPLLTALFMVLTTAVLTKRPKRQT